MGSKRLQAANRRRSQRAVLRDLEAEKRYPRAKLNTSEKRLPPSLRRYLEGLRPADLGFTEEEAVATFHEFMTCRSSRKVADRWGKIKGRWLTGLEMRAMWTAAMLLPSLNWNNAAKLRAKRSLLRKIRQKHRIGYLTAQVAGLWAIWAMDVDPYLAIRSYLQNGGRKKVQERKGSVAPWEIAGF